MARARSAPTPHGPRAKAEMLLRFSRMIREIVPDKGGPKRRISAGQPMNEGKSLDIVDGWEVEGGFPGIADVPRRSMEVERIVP